MVTLRERKTHYGIIVNLPDDHTAEKVNHAVTSAFPSIPAHLQIRGVEMAGQGDLAAANGIKIFFAERCSPWQRGANENFNGLVRQHFQGHRPVRPPDPARQRGDARAQHPARKTLGYRTPAARFRTEARQTSPDS